jgi:Flp pilus assembly protein TadG
MVRHRRIRQFWREEAGVSLTEALLTFPIVMLVFAAFVEFGYAMFQWNQTAKALQYGARIAAVSDSVDPDFDPATAFSTATAALVGSSFPVGTTWSCGPGQATACDQAGIDRIVYGSATEQCQPVGTAGVRFAMCHLNPRIGKNNVIVTYQTTGLGYYGRPDGAVVTVKMEVSGITFDLPILGTLLGIDQIQIPLMPVTVTSEDLKSGA